MSIKEANTGRLQKQLDKLYNFNGRVMSLREKINFDEPLYKSVSIREYAKNDNHDKLKTPKTIFTFWYADNTGFDVPKIVYDWLDIPEKPANVRSDDFIAELLEKEREKQFIPLQEAKDYLFKLEDESPDFFWDQLMPALHSYGITGRTSINPPIVGAMVKTGSFDWPERAMVLWNYWNN